MRHSYLVCYDITDDKRLRKVFQTMRNYGDHLQYSIFECQLTSQDLVRRRADLARIINSVRVPIENTELRQQRTAHGSAYHGKDQVLFVNLGPAEGRGDRVITALGMPYTPVDAPCLIV